VVPPVLLRIRLYPKVITMRRIAQFLNDTRRIATGRRLFGSSAAIAVMVLSSWVPALSQEALWRSYYTTAQKEYQQGNLIESESLLNAALQAACKTDESLSTYFYLAHVSMKRDRFAEAEKCCGSEVSSTLPRLCSQSGVPSGGRNTAQVFVPNDSSKIL